MQRIGVTRHFAKSRHSYRRSNVDGWRFDDDSIASGFGGRFGHGRGAVGNLRRLERFGGSDVRGRSRNGRTIIRTLGGAAIVHRSRIEQRTNVASFGNSSTGVLGGGRRRFAFDRFDGIEITARECDWRFDDFGVDRRTFSAWKSAEQDE